MANTAETEVSKPGHYHCQIFEGEVLMDSCFIPEVALAVGTRFCVNRQAWRIVEIGDGVEGCDKVLKCTKEYS